MRGIKRFKDMDGYYRPVPQSRPLSTRYRAFSGPTTPPSQGQKYQYRIVPLLKVKQPGARRFARRSIVITEIEETGRSPTSMAHGTCLFNRGVIGSQAYAREFGNRDPDGEHTAL